MHSAAFRLAAAAFILTFMSVSCGVENGESPVEVVPSAEAGASDVVPVSESSHRVVLGSDESAFVLRGAMRIQRQGRFDSTLLGIGREWGGDVLVMTGAQFGPFEVRTHVSNRPAPIGRRWEDVDEISFKVLSGELVATELVNNDPTARFIDRPGWYRVRVSAHGRMSDDERDRKGLLELDDYETPVESYLIEAWPAPPAAPKVVRESSAYAAEIRRGPEPEPQIEGQVAGLAGAAAIGRDVDGVPGRRELSGDLTELTVSRTIPTTPGDLWEYLRFGPTLSQHVPSWGFSGGGEVGDPNYSEAGEGHPDQLSGSRGAIRSTITAEDRPVRRQQTWAWLPLSEVSKPLGDQAPLVDSTVTMTYVPSSGTDGRPHTTVTVRHGNIPVEWADDLRAWWAYQLAFMEWFAERY